MSPSRTEVQVEVEGRRLALSNLEKVLYPSVGFTKGQVIDYYTRIAPVLLPHLRDRPLTMKRYPDGVDGPFFFEKSCPDHRPTWVKTAAVWSGSNDRNIDYCLVQDLPTLVWAANLADLEMHTTMARARAIDRPTMIVFDLDPGEPADLVTCCAVALLVRDVLDEDGLRGFPKVSGKKGLQLYVPLNQPRVTYAEATPYAKRVAERLEKAHPELVVSKQRKDLRRGKVLVDWHQNVDSKTTVCVYSLRAAPRPTVSAPVTWDEVEQCAGSGDRRGLVFETHDVLKRVDASGDLFADVLTLKQRLPRAR